MVKRASNSISGTGSRLENETVICFNEAEPMGILSTSSPSVYMKLLKRGFHPKPGYNVNRAVFEIPKNKIRLPSQGRTRLVGEATQ